MALPNVADRRVAIVTGAGRGIGRAVAAALSAQGTAVVVVARTPSEVEEMAAMLRARGASALAVTADVADATSVEELVADAVREFGSVHVLVNAAGVQGPIGPLAKDDVAAWKRTVEINLLGTFLCCRAVLPHMIRQHHGKIINFSGGGAAAPRPHFSAYAASKAAVVRLTETLAEEVREHNIQVNAVAPGAVNTRMLDEVLQAGERAGRQELAQAQRRQREGGTDPAVAAELVAFLASDAAQDITGRLISALHDPWRAWASGEKPIPAKPWYTLRRLDPHTLRPLVDQIGDA